MLKYLPILTASLLRHKLRTAFTLASVLVAFLLYGILAAAKNSFSAGVEVAGADRLMTTNKMSFIQTLPLSDWSQIRSVPGVREVAHSTWFGGVYQDDANVVQMFPVDAESYLGVYGGDFKVNPADKARWLADKSGAMVGRAYAERFHWKIGDHVPLRSNIYRRADGGDTWEFNIDGIFDAGREGIDTQQILIHYDSFQESVGPGPAHGRVGWYIVRLADPVAAPQVAAAIDKLFANSAAETKTSTEKAFVQGFANQIGSIGTIVFAVASAVFFTMLLVTANTMAQSVRERASELGVLKTLGFTDSSVLWLVLAEALLITGIGGVGGLILAAAVVHAMAPSMSQFIGSFYLNNGAVIVGLVLVGALGVAAGAMPAVQALRLQIVDALRRE